MFHASSDPPDVHDLWIFSQQLICPSPIFFTASAAHLLSMDYATWGRDDRDFTILSLLFAFSRVDFLGLALEHCQTATITMTFSRSVGPREPTSALLCNHEMHIFTNVIGLQQMLNGNRVVGDQCVTIQPQEPVWWIIPGQNVQGHLQGNPVAR